MNKKYTINKQIIVLAAAVLILSTLIVFTSNSGIVVGKNNEATNSYLPSVFNKENGMNVDFATPKGALLVFSSTTLSTGNAGGRDGMNAICSAEDPEAHFCNVMEIENAFTTTGVFFNSPFQQSWLDSFLVLGTLNLTEGRYTTGSDWHGGCESWTGANTNTTSLTISENGSNVAYKSCSENAAVTCCKWVP